MGRHTRLTDKARIYVKELVKEKLPATLLYHNYKHLKKVAKSVRLMGKNNNLNNEGLEIIELAAWFHDVGYIDKYKGNEERSIEIATDFLLKQNFPQEKFKKLLGV